MKPKQGYTKGGKNRRMLTPSQLKEKRIKSVISYIKQVHADLSKEEQQALIGEMLRTLKLKN
jgi:hypothetical protein